MLETLVRTLHMVRLTVAALVVLSLVACTGLVDGDGNGGLTPQQVAARKAFTDQAYPALGQCISCHNGSMDNETQKIGFVAGGPDPLKIRETLMGYLPAVINLEAPSSSRLLTKGAHAGPAFIQGDLASVLQWVQLEREAANSDPGNQTPTLATTPMVPLLCSSGLPGDPNCPINYIALDEIGSPGSKVQFVAQALSSSLYLNNLKLLPGPMGAFIEHPLFTALPPDANANGKDDDGPRKADLIDQFFAVKMNLQATATDVQRQIAGGIGTFRDFVGSPNPMNADRIVIHFKKVDMYQPDNMPPPAGGCKVPTAFEGNGVRAAFQANCGSCHRGQNPGATGALDMTGVDVANANVPNNACNQIKLRINTVDLNQSGIYLATTPGNGNHPFTFNNNQAAQDAFKATVNVWINAEKAAP